MNHVEHYHDWLRDAHAMEKQAESMLESMAGRIDNYPDLRARIEQHVNETKRQITVLEEILDRNEISRSVIKDSMSKMAALGQSIGGMFPSDEIVKGSISGYVFEQFEIACYTSLLAAAEKRAIPPPSQPLKPSAEEREMADWLIKHIPQTTEQFLLRSDADGVEAKNNPGGRPMFRHVKQLQYTVRVAEPNPGLANLLLEQFGGPQGELAAACRYFTRGLSDDDPGRKDMLMDIATEELSHLEIIGTLVGMLNKGAKGATAEGTESEAELYRSLTANGNDSHITSLLYGGGTPLTNSAGVPWTAAYIDTIGEPTADLRSNVAAEARAKIVYERLINVTDDHGVKDALAFLMTREARISSL